MSLKRVCLAFFFVCTLITCQKEEYRCTRLVTEKYRCKIYNYRHPLCKKWDHSRCPPPHINRDLSQCVSYRCVRKQSVVKAESKAEVDITPPTPTPEPKTIQPDTHKDNLHSDLAERQIQTLKNELDNLRRVYMLKFFKHPEIPAICFIMGFSQNSRYFASLWVFLYLYLQDLREESIQRQNLADTFRERLDEQNDRGLSSDANNVTSTAAHLQKIAELQEKLAAKQEKVKFQKAASFFHFHVSRNILFQVQNAKLKNARLKSKKAFYKAKTQRLEK